MASAKGSKENSSSDRKYCLPLLRAMTWPIRTTWSEAKASTSPLSSMAMASEAAATGITSASMSRVSSVCVKTSMVVVLVTTATRLPLRPETLGT